MAETFHLPELAQAKTSAEGYRLMIAALAEGRIALRDADVLARILEKGLAIRDAEEFEARLRAAEARSLEAARAAGAARTLPAAQTTVDVGELPHE